VLIWILLVTKKGADEGRFEGVDAALSSCVNWLVSSKLLRRLANVKCV